MNRLTIALAVAIAAVMTAGAPLITDDVTIAAKRGRKVSQPEGAAVCPAKVGRYILEKVNFRPEGPIQECRYDHPKRYAGGVRLTVEWWPDIDGERERCDVRDPGLEPWHGSEGSWELKSSRHKMVGSFHLVGEANDLVPVGKAESVLRSLMASAEPLAHRCVPDVAPTMGDGLVCPRLLPGDLVRSDWYEGPSQVVDMLGDPAKELYDLHCIYLPAFVEEGDELMVRITWREGDPTRGSTCIPRVDRHESVVDDKYDTTSTRLGYHPVEVEISDGFVMQGLGPVLADRLAAAAGDRTQRCSGAPAGPAPYEGSVSGTTTGITTTIELSGERAAALDEGGIGTVVELTPEERDALVASLGEDTLSDEHLGTHGRIVAVGTVASAADGERVVSVTVELIEASPEPSPTPSPTPTPTPEPEPAEEPEPEPEPADESDPAEEPEPEPEPADESDPAEEPVTDARAAGQALLDDLEAQLDAAKQQGGGSIGVGAELIERLAGLEAIADKVAEVRLEDKEVFVRTKDIVKDDGTTEPGREVWIRPIVEKDKANIVIRKHVEFELAGIPFGKDMILPVGALIFVDEELPKTINKLIADVNAQVDDRKLQVDRIDVTPEGIEAVLVPKPGG